MSNIPPNPRYEINSELGHRHPSLDTDQELSNPGPSSRTDQELPNPGPSSGTDQELPNPGPSSETDVSENPSSTYEENPKHAEKTPHHHVGFGPTTSITIAPRLPQRFSLQSPSRPPYASAWAGGGGDYPRCSRRCLASHSYAAIDRNDDGEYSGIPDVDKDIEVGKRIVRRRKLSKGCPPSSGHAEVELPGLNHLRKALTQSECLQRLVKRLKPQAVVTPFHDAHGRMHVEGSRRGEYVGDLYGGLPHGFGQHWTSTRCPPCGGATGFTDMLYEGAWEHGTKRGYGRMLYKNGQEYRGHFKDGERHGSGAMWYNDGSIYDGVWAKGRRNGSGTHYFNDGAIYRGTYCIENREGWGVYHWANRSRRFEGEWVANDPVCGYSTINNEEEYDALIKMIPDWCDAPLPADNLQDEVSQLPILLLRYPEVAYYPHSCVSRQNRLNRKRAAMKSVPNPNIIPEHKGSLTPLQMEGLRSSFDKLSPGYGRGSKVYTTQMRRLLLLARLSPDCDMGRKLIAELKEAVSSTGGITYNNFMKIILSFHHPALFLPSTTSESNTTICEAST